VVAREELVVVEKREVERDGCPYPSDPKLAEGPRSAGGRPPREPPNDEQRMADRRFREVNDFA
jgi:hypothetical protein